MRIMAIDYGDAHTGIAISDPTELLAGYTTVITAPRRSYSRLHNLRKSMALKNWY